MNKVCVCNVLALQNLKRPIDVNAVLRIHTHYKYTQKVQLCEQLYLLTSALWERHLVCPHRTPVERMKTHSFLPHFRCVDLTVFFVACESEQWGRIAVYGLRRCACSLQWKTQQLVALLLVGLQLSVN